MVDADSLKANGALAWRARALAEGVVDALSKELCLVCEDWHVGGRRLPRARVAVSGFNGDVTGEKSISVRQRLDVVLLVSGGVAAACLSGLATR